MKDKPYQCAVIVTRPAHGNMNLLYILENTQEINHISVVSVTNPSHNFVII